MAAPQALSFYEDNLLIARSLNSIDLILPILRTVQIFPQMLVVNHEQLISGSQARSDGLTMYAPDLQSICWKTSHCKESP